MANLRFRSLHFIRFLIIGVSTLGALATPCVSLAQATEEKIPGTVFCAQVYPCDSYANILPEFAEESSGCYKFYLSQCEEIRIKRLLHCSPENAEINSLVKQNEQLRKRLRRRSKLPIK